MGQRDREKSGGAMTERPHAISSVAVFAATTAFFFLRRQWHSRAAKKATALAAHCAKQRKQAVQAVKEAERVAAQRAAQAAEKAAEKQRADTRARFKPYIETWQLEKKGTLYSVRVSVIFHTNLAKPIRPKSMRGQADLDLCH